MLPYILILDGLYKYMKIEGRVAYTLSSINVRWLPLSVTYILSVYILYKRPTGKSLTQHLCHENCHLSYICSVFMRCKKKWKK